MVVGKCVIGLLLLYILQNLLGTIFRVAFAVLYRRIWSIVGKYSILCCDTSKCFSVVHGIRKDGFPITNSLAPQSTNTLAEYNQGRPNSIGKGLPVCTRMMTKFNK
jgi:hypothetical protein